MLDKAIPGIKASIDKALSSVPKGSASGIDFNNILAGWKAGYLNKFESSRATIENAFKSTISAGYKNIFIAGA